MDSTKVFVDSMNAVIKFSSENPAIKHECNANWADVAIVAIICLSIIAIVAICVFGYKCIKKQESKSLLDLDNAKWRRENEEKKDKQRAELLRLKLDRLKELDKSIGGEYIKEITKEIVSLDSTIKTENETQQTETITSTQS